MEVKKQHTSHPQIAQVHARFRNRQALDRGGRLLTRSRSRNPEALRSRRPPAGQYPDRPERPPSEEEIESRRITLMRLFLGLPVPPDFAESLTRIAQATGL